MPLELFETSVASVARMGTARPCGVVLKYLPYRFSMACGLLIGSLAHPSARISPTRALDVHNPPPWACLHLLPGADHGRCLRHHWVASQAVSVGTLISSLGLAD